MSLELSYKDFMTTLKFVDLFSLRLFCTGLLLNRVWKGGRHITERSGLCESHCFCCCRCGCASADLNSNPKVLPTCHSNAVELMRWSCDAGAVSTLISALVACPQKKIVQFSSSAISVMRFWWQICRHKICPCSTITLAKAVFSALCFCNLML